MDRSSGPSQVDLRVAPRRRLADEWALVLLAEGLRPTVRRVRGGFAVAVPAAEAEPGAAALTAYDRENPIAPPTAEPLSSLDLRTALGVWAGLLAFFAVTGPRNPALAWFERGSADAEQILLGQLWRTVTALTLHADLPHVLGNALAGTLFLGAVCSALGAGLGCALVLLAGASGNLANAAFHGSDHAAVGASTAVFGAVGLLTGLAAGRRRRRGARGRRAWLPPIAAGLALLAMLGTSGARVDVWGHFFGFLAGSALGVAALALSRRPGRWMQWGLGAAALGTVVSCWHLALA